MDPSSTPEEPREPRIEDFLDSPTRDLGHWEWLWSEDRRFPLGRRPGLLGSAVHAVKRLLRPLVRSATADLWDRQRSFNLILLEHLRRETEAAAHRDVRLSRLEGRTADLDRRLVAEVGRAEARADEQDTRMDEQERLAGERLDLRDRRLEALDHRSAHLEKFLDDGLQEIMRYNDALYSRLDQKVEKHRHEATQLSAHLAAAIEISERSGDSEALRRAVDESGYVELEARHRGTEAELRERAAVHLDRFANRQHVLDLGCGRGELLAMLSEQGVGARGVDGSEEMVRLCTERGVAAERGDLFAALEACEPGSLDGVVSLHVIEHLPPAGVNRLVRLAWRALEPGGVLLLETPNPLSMRVAATQFWKDPTHVRPVHPDALVLAYDLAGFTDVEVLFLHPFAEDQRLPELSSLELGQIQERLAYEINSLRDRLDETIYGDQDYAVVGVKPNAVG